MDKDIKKSISVTDKDAQYDEKAKNLLGHKIILAHILVKTIDEFKGMNPKDVVQCIEGEPYISRVPIDAGSTNVEKEQDGEKVIGLNTENSELNEGLVRFDIPLESDIRKDVNDMCNLSQGIKEQAYVEGTENGIAIGKQEGITIGKREGIAETIIKMYRKGYEAEQIGDILDMEVEEVQEIIENE